MRQEKAADNMRSMITDAGAAPTLSVSIVLHESDLDLLARTLESLHASILAARSAGALGSVHLGLLDNASSEAYQSALQKQCDRLREQFDSSISFELKLGSDNPGFGIGHNRLQARGSQDVLLILNPDVELATDALACALAFLAGRPQAQALNPSCRRSDGEPEYLCKRYPSALVLLLRGLVPESLRGPFRARLERYEYRDLSQETPAAVELLSGACLLCRRERFDDVGGFAPEFFMYFEDFDLSRRLAEVGDLVYLPQMRIIHHGGFAARKGGRHIRWFARSAIRFFSRHGWRLF